MEAKAHFDGPKAMQAAETDHAETHKDAADLRGCHARATHIVHAIRRWMEGEQERGVAIEDVSAVATHICGHLLAPVTIALATKEFLEENPDHKDGEMAEIDIGGWVKGGLIAIDEVVRVLFREGFVMDSNGRPISSRQ